MKSLENYKDEINNCSRCGLCQSGCPVFNVTKNDCTSPKGKYTILNELLKTNKKPSKLVEKYINTCTNCQKCLNLCPSKINMVKINSAYKYSYGKNYLPSINFAELFLSVFSFFINIYRFLSIDKITDKLYNLYIKCGYFGKNILLFNSIITKESKLNKIKNLENPTYKVLFFQGCMNKYINPSSKNAILNFLNKNNVDVTVGDFTCCGRMYYLMGKEKDYVKIVKRNKKVIEQSKYDYVIFDCATCFDTIFNYSDINNTNFIMVEDFLEKIHINKDIPLKAITYFKPCLQKEIPEIIKNSKCYIYDNSQNCCGGAMPFNLFNKDLSQKIGNDTIIDISKTNPDYIVTNCALCKYGLSKSLIDLKMKKKTLSIIELMDKI